MITILDYITEDEFDQHFLKIAEIKLENVYNEELLEILRKFQETLTSHIVPLPGGQLYVEHIGGKYILGEYNGKYYIAVEKAYEEYSTLDDKIIDSWYEYCLISLPALTKGCHTV